VAIIDLCASTPIPRTIDSFAGLPEQVTPRVRAWTIVCTQSAALCGSAPRGLYIGSNGGTMSGEERRRRAVVAQGFAAIALFVFAHGARAATPASPALTAGNAATHLVAS
jgi:hypothetical protein